MRSLFKSRNQENQRGVAAVEFAIVLPLLLILFAGITEFGIAYYNKQVITNASREGARAGFSTDTPNSDIQEAAYNYAKDRVITFGANNFSLQDITPNREDGYITVTVNFNYTYLILAGFRFFGADFGQTLNIRASTTMEML